MLQAFKRDNVIAPVPQPTSSISQKSVKLLADTRCRTKSINISVCGSGINIGGTNFKIISRNSHWPIIYCTGILEKNDFNSEEGRKET